MRGDIYSNMPDTTSQVSSYRRPLRRLAASTLLFLSSLLLVASMGLAQEDSFEDGLGGGVVCEEFDSPEAAADYAAGDDEAFAQLDSDGNGIVCDEDPELFTNGGEDTIQEDTVQEDTVQDLSSDDDFDNNDEDLSNTEDAYADDYYAETPNTGGVALLPLAGSALTACLGAFMIIRRR